MRPKKRLWLRLTWLTIGLLLGLVVFVSVGLPRMIERRLTNALRAAGVDDVEMRVRSVGFDRLVIDEVELGADGWSARADKVTAGYSWRDLRESQLKELWIDGLEVDVFLPSGAGESGWETDARDPAAGEVADDGSADFGWVHSARDGIGRLGEVDANGAVVTIHRDGESVARDFDFRARCHPFESMAYFNSLEFEGRFFIQNSDPTAVGTHMNLVLQLEDMGSVLGLADVVFGAEFTLPDNLSVGDRGLVWMDSEVKAEVIEYGRVGGGFEDVIYDNGVVRVGADRLRWSWGAIESGCPLEFDFGVKQFELSGEGGVVLGMVSGSDPRVNGEVRFGADGTEVVIAVKDLALAGEENGVAYQLDDIDLNGEMRGVQLKVNGALSLGGNRLPLTYQHAYQSYGDAWELAGWAGVAECELTEPVDTLGVVLKELAGSAFSGGIGGSMEFASAHDRAFDGALEVAVKKGELGLADGPVFHGIDGTIALPSLASGATDGFQQVSVESVDAWDVELVELVGEYQLLADGGVKLRGVSAGFLGGRVAVDPFTMPGGDEDYGFTLRLKNLDVAQVAGLFPEFNGTVSGRLDGVLPIQNRNGLFWPQRGSLTLTKGTKGRLRYDAQGAFSAGLDPRSDDYKKMKMVEDSLENLELKVLSLRLFDPDDEGKAVVVRIEGESPDVREAPPIILNVNGFMPEDEVLGYFDLLFRHRDKLNFGL
ncbi:intermembrane phospholipid transport protein YdbH family protein [Sulfuriroseicoccus oceanibius]|uniref:YdbH domain-containing protein n=1 Tax=Sulfuriroseicoccus oceanibius TaxID=2707525 RepID=A0A6B3LFC4_9BACT|nr:YdbH domain-containing protein [Sulfuriroseicoccus oceanibius]QQL45686.1 YdbH domain-containing protein [Sulfuriroseicoccus oceanibius]